MVKFDWDTLEVGAVIEVYFEKDDFPVKESAEILFRSEDFIQLKFISDNEEITYSRTEFLREARQVVFQA